MTVLRGIWYRLAIAGGHGFARPEGANLENIAWQVLSQTRWGKLWLCRELLLRVIIGLMCLLDRVWRAPTASGSRLPSVLGQIWSWNTICVAAGLAAIALSVVQALTSHAAAVNTGTGLAVVTDALHLLAAGVWLGGLFALAVGLLPLM